MSVRRAVGDTIAGVALITMIILAGCDSRNTYVPPPPPEVTVSTPFQETVTNFAEFTGITEAVESVEIRARVEGYLDSMNFTPGSMVKKGDLLFVIDPKPFQAKLDEAEAELSRQFAELKRAEATLNRKELALKERAVSELDVIQSRADRDVVKAAIEAARATIQTARLKLSYTHVHAPISGKISRNLVDVGNLVGAAERTLLATIVNDDPIYVYFNVSERDLLYYQKNLRDKDVPTNSNGSTPVYLGLSDEDGYSYDGRADYADNRLDASSGTIQVRGVFANSDHLFLPGLFARVRVPIGTRKNALLIPEQALGQDQQGWYVLVVNSENAVEYRPVRTGVRVDGKCVIEKGIGPDDRVVISGIQRARPGSTVTPKKKGTEPPEKSGAEQPPLKENKDV